MSLKKRKKIIKSKEKEFDLDHDILKKSGKLKKSIYKKELLQLQIELVKLQKWIVKNNKRVLVIFEGRDAAGKGGVIKRITSYLNPRGARVAALLKPSDIEKGQWYFQRYTKHLPDSGEMVLFDRSWYNRAGVEKVMEFCTSQEYQKFMGQVPMFEQMLVEDGIIFFKYFLEITKEEEQKRLNNRKKDPLKRWKLSDMDIKSLNLYDEYTKAKVEMLARTHSPYAPWIIVDANDKKRARINIIKDILAHIDYEGKEKADLVMASEPSIVNLYSHLSHYD